MPPITYREGGLLGADVLVAFDLDGTLVTESPDAFGPAAGAMEALQWCRARGWRVALWTINHRRVAMTRLEATGIPLDLFDAIVAVAHKDPKTVHRRLRPLARGGKLAVVGNSWRHDVAPALGLADAVVWVQGRRKPGVEGTPEDPDRFPVAVVPSVAQVPDVLPDALRRGYDKAAWRWYGVSQFPCLSGLPDPGCFASWRRWGRGRKSNRHFDFLAR